SFIPPEQRVVQSRRDWAILHICILLELRGYHLRGWLDLNGGQAACVFPLLCTHRGNACHSCRATTIAAVRSFPALPLERWKPSQKVYDWMGGGIYFWVGSRSRRKSLPSYSLATRQKRRERHSSHNDGQDARLALRKSRRHHSPSPTKEAVAA